MRLLFARAGDQHCPVCDALITSQTPQQIVDQILEYPTDTRFMVLAPMIRDRKGEYSKIIDKLREDGFSRVQVDGETRDLSETITLEKKLRHNISVIVDRLQLKDDIKGRLTDSVELALKTSNGVVEIEFVDFEQGDPNRLERFSSFRACPNNHPITLESIEPRTFSFNAPYGACEECTGIGYKMEIDPELIIPNPDLSILEGAIEPWSSTFSDWYFSQLENLMADEPGFSMTKPFGKLPKDVRDTVLYGHKSNVQVKMRNRFGKVRVFNSTFEGVIPMMMRRYNQTESENSKKYYESYMLESPCIKCKGKRLKDEVLAVKINGESISDVADKSIAVLKDWVENLGFTGSKAEISKLVVREIRERVGFMVNVGLTYLTLSRSAGSLSGGEAQRIRLATQIGAGLAGVLYVLDEPSIGLHQSDNQKLISALLNLRDLGNTLIVVEHDEETIRAADYVVDIGPRAGELGGHITYAGEFKGILDASDSITGEYLAGKKSIEVPKKRRKVNSSTDYVTVVGAQENNLKNITAKFPLGVFTAVTGVSGSGKSTLVNQILYKALQNRLSRAKVVPGKHKKLTGVAEVSKVIHVDQGPIGKTPRSNPATYTGVFDKIRTIFAELPESKARGYKPGRFSFNVRGGRCEACSGDGTLKIEMNFLPDVYVLCEVCEGKRYNRETLEIKYKGKSIADVLHMTIHDAVKFFENIPSISRYINTLNDVGLGYVRLGQSATTLSGGESQRVKLASELQQKTQKGTLYILDEPTTCLHFDDIKKLLAIFNRLVDNGNTLIVIEHNLDVIKSADYIMDLGPEGGDNGGKIIATGTPEQIAKNKDSITGVVLAEVL
jgi:excinuclease ABC subunit A